MMLKCPCGCGEEIPINLDHRAGKAWRYYETRTRGVTLYPSIWRDTGCQSHFIVWSGRILLFEAFGDDDRRDSVSNPTFLSLIEGVRVSWPSGGLASYVQIADELGEIPWDVLDACRHLVRRGVLVEGMGKQRGMFRRK